MRNMRMEWLRLITPVLVTIAIFFAADARNTIKDVQTTLFTHLTNHEIHIPRGTIVTDAEFNLHCQFQQEQMSLLTKALQELSNDFRTNIKGQR